MWLAPIENYSAIGTLSADRLPVLLYDSSTLNMSVSVYNINLNIFENKITLHNPFITGWKQPHDTETASMFGQISYLSKSSCIFYIQTLWIHSVNL